MLTKRYMVSTTAPPKFTVAHLKGLGFASSNDRAVIPLLRDFGCLGPDATPTGSVSPLSREVEVQEGPRDGASRGVQTALTIEGLMLDRLENNEGIVTKYLNKHELRS
jgi:hypothetical protein